jgi:threonine/homoserine/homoserine lactone efflux protein
LIAAIFTGLVIGVILAMPPGPFTIASFKYVLRNDVKGAYALSYAAGLTDILYSLIAISASSLVIGTFMSFFDGNPIAFLLFQVVCVIGLLVYGIYQIRYNSDAEIGETEEKPTILQRFFKKIQEKGPFFIGLGIASTNLANPTFLPFLTSFFTAIQKLGLFPITVLNNFIFSVAFGAGNFIWLYTLIRIVNHYKERMSLRLIERLHKFAGFTLLVFSTLLGYRVIVYTKWTELIPGTVAF